MQTLTIQKGILYDYSRNTSICALTVLMRLIHFIWSLLLILWYTRKSLGHNTLTKTISRLCTAAGIETNHSATRLYQSGVDEQLVMERTGHRRVRSYKRTSAEQQEVLSDILNNKDKVPKLCNFEIIANQENNSVSAYFTHQQEHLSSQLATCSAVQIFR